VSPLPRFDGESTGYNAVHRQRFCSIGIGILRHRVVPSAQKADREPAQGRLVAIDTAAITSEISAIGRFLVTRKQSDIASFKTPGLRNAVVTAPYFHDGSMQTLWDVMDRYNKGDGIKDPWLDKDMQPLACQNLRSMTLVAFLASLTSPEYKEIGDREYARQLNISKVGPQRDTARSIRPEASTASAAPVFDVIDRAICLRTAGKA
jgi:cytochrome c peroxidase